MGPEADDARQPADPAGTEHAPGAAVAAVARVATRPEVVSVAVVAAYYVAAVASGTRFSTEMLHTAWQLQPYDELTASPLRSVYELHVQPPLFNLMVGTVLWLPLGPDAVALQLTYLALLAVLAALVAFVVRELTGSRAVAVVVAVIACADPEVFSGAFEVRYELPVACLLVALGALVVRPAARDRRLLQVAAVATAVVLTRTLYHPLWMLVLALPFLPVLRGVPRRRLLAAAAVPVVLVGGVMVKNAALVGQPALSTWTGMNLLRSVQPAVPEARLAELHEAGEISVVGLVGAFRPLAAYGDATARCVAEARGSGSLDLLERRGPAGQATPNFNHRCYVPLYEQAQGDAWALARHEPSRWLQARREAAMLAGSRSYDPGSSPSWVVRATGAAYRVLKVEVDGELTDRQFVGTNDDPLHYPSRFPLLLAAGTVLAGVVAVRSGLRLWRGQAEPRRHAAAAWAMAVTIVWTTLGGIATELGEQARFRASVQPLIYVLIASTLTGTVTRWLAARNERRAEGPPPVV